MAGAVVLEQRPVLGRLVDAAADAGLRGLGRRQRLLGFPGQGPLAGTAGAVAVGNCTSGTT
jgi:hypothetical protein